MTLTPVQVDELKRLEAIVESGLSGFIDTGCALMQIRESNLYFPHATFEIYCKVRWGIGKSHAHRLMQAADIAVNLLPDKSTTSPIGEVPDKVSSKLPKSESHVRPLAQLPKDEQAGAWNEAVKTAPDGNVTAKHVESVVQSRTERLGIKPPKSFEVKDKPDQSDETGEESKEEEIKRINSLVESFCRQLAGLIDEIPEDAWLTDMGRAEGARQKIRDACGTLRTGKCHSVCPVCKGEGGKCKPCLGTGRMPKVNYDRAV